MKSVLLSVVTAAALATGCYTQGDVGVGYSYGYAAPAYGYGYAAPDMYVMGNGVSVVAYADYPTFYSDNYYWMYNGGLWYRSSYYGGGWAVSYDVPYRVRSIDRPHSYARFTPGRGWARAPSPAYRGGYQGGGTRDHRAYRGNYGGYNGGYARTAPSARDHRTHRPPAATYTPPARNHRAPAATYSPPARDHRAPAATYSPPPARDHRAPSSSSPPSRDFVPRGGPTHRPSARDHRR